MHSNDQSFTQATYKNLTSDTQMFLRVYKAVPITSTERITAGTTTIYMELVLSVEPVKYNYTRSVSLIQLFHL